MCMIAYRPSPTKGKRGGNMPNKVIDLAMTRHSDGFGVSYRAKSADGRYELRTEKFGPRDRDAFRKAIKRVDRAGDEYVAHFRYATHGARDVEHSHPYEYIDPIEGPVLIFHNGIIDIATQGPESDTEVFVRDVLAQLPSRWWANDALSYLVTQTIGWSKLVIMTASETVNMHEKRGTWDGGIWYSSAHKQAEYTSYTSTDKGWAAKGSTATTSGAMVPYAAGAMPLTTEWQTSRAKSAEESYRRMTGEAEKPKSSIITPRWAQRDERTFSSTGSPMLGKGRDVDEPITFQNAGHTVRPCVAIDPDTDGDYEDGVICDECYTIGDLFIIDGTGYIDMAHRAGSTDEDGDEDEVTPVRMSILA